jgi:hypothetical protein
VRHDPAVHGEGVSVPHRPAASGRPADVRDKGRGLGLLCFVDEFLVAERRLWLFVQNGCAGGVEESDAAPVDVAVALHLQRVGCVEQPERCPDADGPRGQPEQTAHGAPFAWLRLSLPAASVTPGSSLTESA